MLLMSPRKKNFPTSSKYNKHVTVKIYASNLEETVSNEMTAWWWEWGMDRRKRRDDTREEMADDKFYGR